MRDQLVGVVSDHLRHVDDVVNALMAGEISARKLIIQLEESSVDDQVFSRWAGVRCTYFVRMEVPRRTCPIKIGVARDPEQRLDSLSTGSPYPLTLLAAIPIQFLSEHVAHFHLSKSRLRGEWFAPRRAVLELADEAARFVRLQDERWPWKAPATFEESQVLRRELAGEVTPPSDSRRGS